MAAAAEEVAPSDVSRPESDAADSGERRLIEIVEDAATHLTHPSAKREHLVAATLN